MIVFKKIINKISKLISIIVARRKINPTNDPNKAFEVSLWLEIIGQTYDGQSCYKQRYYDLLTDEDSKSKIRNTLLNMLKSRGYSITNKSIIAYVCADIGITEALQDIKSLRKSTECSSFDRQILTSSYEALSRGITVNELIYNSNLNNK